MGRGNGGRNGGGASGRRPLLSVVLDYSELVVYYVATLALLATIVVLFVSVGGSLLEVFESDPLETALEVLDRVLLIFIFVELLITIQIIVRENQIVGEPFILIGLIAVVRRILLVTAEAGQTADPARFQDLITELGVLAALILALAAALYVARRTQRSQEEA